MEAAVLGSGLDDPIDNARHLACNGNVGHALAIRAEGIFPDISFELLSKAVLSLLDRDGGCHPESASQPSVAVLGQLSGATELAGLLSGQVEAAELQELAVMVKAAQVAGFGQDGQGQNGAYARNLFQATEVIVVAEISVSSLFQLLPKLAKPAHLVEQNAEHSHCFRVFFDRQPDGTLGAVVDVFQQPALGNLAADDRPSPLNELFSIEGGDRCRRGERLQKIQQPQGPGCMVMALDLGKVQRQVVRQQAVL